MIAIKYNKKETLLEDITKLCEEKGIKTVYQLSKKLQEKYGNSLQNYEGVLSGREKRSENYKNDLINKIKNL